jgi:predicted lipoprotein with Yx(FWY)xxD motif
MNTTMIIGAIVVVIVIVVGGAYLLTNGAIFAMNGTKGASGQGAANTSSLSTTVQPTTTVVTTISPGISANLTVNSTGNNSTLKANATVNATTNTTKSYTVNIAYNASVGGNYLVNATGWTMYLYTPDTPFSGNSTCYSSCATYWPVVHYTANSLVLPPTLNASDFNTIIRTDGTTQLTYKGYPVYYYLGDKAAGQTSGQGVMGIWYVFNVPQIMIPSTANKTA